MRTYRMLGLLIATATALILAPAAAAQAAEPYPAAEPASSVSDGEVSAGGSVTFRGEGFNPLEDISISVSYGGSDSTAALTEPSGGFVLAGLPEQRRAFTVSASATGTFSVEISLDQVGTATLTARGLESGLVLSEVVEVVDTSGGGGGDGDNNAGGNLPTTGSDGSVLTYTLYGGLGAILVGAGAIWLARSRRRPTEL